MGSAADSQHLSCGLAGCCAQGPRPGAPAAQTSGLMQRRRGGARIGTRWATAGTKRRISRRLASAGARRRGLQAATATFSMCICRGLQPARQVAPLPPEAHQPPPQLAHLLPLPVTALKRRLWCGLLRRLDLPLCPAMPCQLVPASAAMPLPSTGGAVPAACGWQVPPAGKPQAAGSLVAPPPRQLRHPRLATEGCSADSSQHFSPSAHPARCCSRLPAAAAALLARRLLAGP